LKINTTPNKVEFGRQSGKRCLASLLSEKIVSTRTMWSIKVLQEEKRKKDQDHQEGKWGKGAWGGIGENSEQENIFIA